MTVDTEKMKALALARELVDEDGENRAVRTFLMQYGLPGLTVGAMRSHMTRSGWGEECMPPFARNAYSAAHLTKAGAQIWIRHLFSLEGAELATRCRAEGGDTSQCVACEGSPSDDNNPCAICGCAAPAAGTEKDAERFRSAIAFEDNAATLYAAVLNNAPDVAAIRCEFDAAIGAHAKAGKEEA